MCLIINSGDHDFVVPFLSTQAWIRALNYSIIDEWRQWIVEDQVAGWVFCHCLLILYMSIQYQVDLQSRIFDYGYLCFCSYTRTYSNKMTFATVKARYLSAVVHSINTSFFSHLNIFSINFFW